MSENFGPPGWAPNSLLRRYISGAPSSYDAATNSAECIISAGVAVQRFYGSEVLEITQAAVDLSRIPVPLLDSHSQASITDTLGRITQAWIAGGKLHGRIIFAETPRGKLAEQMVSRNEISSISAGYRVDEWEIVDGDGDVVDAAAGVRWNDENLTFTAKRWTLLEASLVTVGADSVAAIRSLDTSDSTSRQGPRQGSFVDVMARMAARQAMSELQTAMDDADDE